MIISIHCFVSPSSSPVPPFLSNFLEGYTFLVTLCFQISRQLYKQIQIVNSACTWPTIFLSLVNDTYFRSEYKKETFICENTEFSLRVQWSWVLLLQVLAADVNTHSDQSRTYRMTSLWIIIRFTYIILKGLSLCTELVHIFYSYSMNIGFIM